MAVSFFVVILLKKHTMADNYLEKKFEEHNAQSSVRRNTYTKTKIRNVFVTGGANGIGSAIVRNMRMAGNNVAFCDIDAEAGQALASTTGTLFVRANVCEPTELLSALNSVAEHWGNIDIIVNNVGISKFAPLTETTIEAFDEVINTNVRPIFITSQYMARQRKNQPISYGRIINISSTRYRQSEVGTEAYSASKGAVASLTHALAMSMAQYGVTVNCISPGWIETGNYDALQPSDHAQHPSGRVGKPDDVARIVRFLCDENNNFINGENIVCDGGISRKMIYK